MARAGGSQRGSIAVRERPEGIVVFLSGREVLIIVAVSCAKLIHIEAILSKQVSYGTEIRGPASHRSQSVLDERCQLLSRVSFSFG